MASRGHAINDRGPQRIVRIAPPGRLNGTRGSVLEVGFSAAITALLLARLSALVWDHQINDTNYPHRLLSDFPSSPTQLFAKPYVRRLGSKSRMPRHEIRKTFDLVGWLHHKRPFRVHYDPTQDGAEVVNMVLDRVRAEMWRRISLTDVLTPRDLPAQPKSAA